MSWAVYAVAFRSSARRTVQAPGQLVIRVLFYGVILGVLSALWKVACVVNGGTIAGYDFRSMLWYLVASEGAVIAINPRLIEYIGVDIGSGGIAIEMLRPISVVGLRIATALGEALVRFGFAVSLGVAFAWFTVGPPPDLAAVGLALPAAILAIGANLAAQHSFAAIAFWVNDSKAAWFLYQKLVFLVGGMLLPLELFPPLLAHISRFLPFWTMSYVPARLLSGHFEPWLLLVQAAWLVALMAGAAVVFGIGQRKLEAVGG
ncbi:MAG: viologen exporter family transport system permease protein [Actinomycetota bacterium]|jgi:ABC-2 type transport system permease protein|nr:viologen exporter family transport system permease protein [Actinomycetota bacterium]